MFPEFHDMSSFCSLCCMPARPRRPQNKAILAFEACHISQSLLYLGRAVLSAPGGPYKGIIGEIREIHTNQYHQQKLNFGIMWQLRGSSSVQNTRMGCGNHLPTRKTHSGNLMFLTFLARFDSSYVMFSGGALSTKRAKYSEG